jgi:hypothetical protein
MMLTATWVDDDRVDISATRELLVYRGFSVPSEHDQVTPGQISPCDPLPAPNEWLACFHHVDSMEHVLEIKRDRFKSFSLRRDVACAYATQDRWGRRNPGWLAVARISVSQAISSGGSRPYVFISKESGTVWIRPTNAPPPTPREFPAWQDMLNLALRDDEFLLANGELLPSSVEQVMPSDCPNSPPISGFPLTILG